MLERVNQSAEGTVMAAFNSLPDNKILDWSKLKKNCRRHFEVYLKWKISTIQGRKHFEIRRNCLLQAIIPFLTMFSTAIYL